MFHHVVAFRFKQDVSEADVRALRADLVGLAARLEGLASYACGSDLGIRDGNADFAVAAAFETREALQGYLTHPEHLAIVERYVVPMVEQRHGAQFEA